MPRLIQPPGLRPMQPMGQPQPKPPLNSTDSSTDTLGMMGQGGGGSTQPPDVRLKQGGGAGNAAPRPNAPTPTAAQPPLPFTPMAPEMDPGAMTVAMRAPYMGSPQVQGGMEGAGQDPSAELMQLLQGLQNA